MALARFALSGADLSALDAVGLKLAGLRGTGSLSADSRIEAPTAIASAVPPEAFLDIGAFCSLGGASLNNARVGRYGSVASGVTIGAHEHPTDWLTTSRTAYYPEIHGWDALVAGPAAASVHARKRPYLTSCPVTTIGPDAWIGQGAFVKAGVTIGAGAIVGARATVLHDVPPYAIVVGTPARVVRLRFPALTIERLLNVAWWRYSIYDLFDAPMDSIDAALDVIETLVARGALHPMPAASSPPPTSPTPPRSPPRSARAAMARAS